MLGSALALAALAGCGGDSSSSATAADTESSTTTLGAGSSVGCIGTKGTFIGERPVGPGFATAADALQSRTTPEVVRRLRPARISAETQMYGGYSPGGVLVALFGITQLPDGTFYLSGSETCVGYESMMSPRETD